MYLITLQKETNNVIQTAITVAILQYLTYKFKAESQIISESYSCYQITTLHL